jgi:DNA-binding response OmpR family regulator
MIERIFVKVLKISLLNFRITELSFSSPDESPKQRSPEGLRELMLLKVLMREPGRVFTRTELCERVWEYEHGYGAKLVEVFIGRLQWKIGDPPDPHRSSRWLYHRLPPVLVEI